MLVNLTSTDKKIDNYSNFTDVASFARSVSDAEATRIVCSNFLCSFSQTDLPKVIELILKKMRMGAKLTINEIDFESVDIEATGCDQINSFLHQNSISLKSLLTLQYIESIIPKNLIVTNKGLDKINFSLTLERVQ